MNPPKTHILLLRGINVGGHRKIKMADLKLLLLDNGYLNVQTYIQSGNVICKSEKEKPQVKQHIESLIVDNYGFEVTILILSPLDLQKIMDNNPFVKQQSPIEKLYCTFLEYRPTPESKDLLLSYKTEDEEFVFEESHIYFCYHKGYGKAKVTNPFIEKKLNLQATSRNWKTIGKLLELTRQ
ncbi:DUF1697 domain-containing protein [Galbibacter sp.]|uniref:DUF1697 domain-containing protein n=1 Tax=Galbibacter sp. TaxID=2918471 RepID=UPI002BDC6895|nr:DUF1697 domain-containing protein [Galbibacter sp.]HLV63824.1 DUF1697 domain-containing protein [Galbibacter sp.]